MMSVKTRWTPSTLQLTSGRIRQQCLETPYLGTWYQGLNLPHQGSSEN